MILKSSSSYKNASIEVIENARNVKQSVGNLILGAKTTAEEIQNITQCLQNSANY